ncbi:tetratricopeptide repeat protein [Actinomycetes bacterium KLBMP 9797]
MFGQLVRAYRRQQGRSQEELAEAAGLSVRGIRKIEGGHTETPRPATVRLLADALNLTGAERNRFVHAAAGTSSKGEVAVPRQLPVDVYDFVGRDAHLAQLDALLPDSGDRPPTVVISAIGGAAGIGKTALALHWAHRVADRFPDGQLYIDLRGFTPTGTSVDPATAMRGFLEALGVPPQRIPNTEEAQYGSYRSILAERRMLVLLDNARDAEQVRPLLPGASGCLTLVTSRRALTGLAATHSARLLTLDLLPAEDAWSLLARRIGDQRVAAEPDAVAEIIACCVRLPLALVIVAAYTTIRPDVSLTDLAKQLGAARNRLDLLGGDDPMTDVRTVFSWSYQVLDPGAARLFRLLSLHPGPDISVAATASLAGVPVPEAEHALGELTRAHLVTQSSPGRYTFHDLLRGYARELTETIDAEPDRRDAQLRMLDHYLHTGHQAALLLWPPRTSLPLPAAYGGTTPEQLPNQAVAQGWFTAEKAAILSIVGWAADTGFDAYAWRLAWTLEDFLDRRGESDSLAAAQRTGLRAATRLGDLRGQARMHHGLARAVFRQGHYDDAATQLRHAFDLYGELGDQVGQADTLRNLALVLGRQGRPRAALDTAHQALELYPPESHPSGRGQTLNGIGWLHITLGEYEKALIYCEQALSVLRECDDPTGAATALDSLGKAHQHLGQYREAVECYQHAIDLFRYLDHRQYCANVFAWLGDTHRAAGDWAAADGAWRRALDILDELDDPEAEQLKQRLRNDLEQSSSLSV